MWGRIGARQHEAWGPSDWFTGDVYIDAVAAAPAPSRVTANLVHFMPGARTHWHRHPLSQTVFVTEGVGLCQRRGGPVEVIRPGDCVLFEAGEECRCVPSRGVGGPRTNACWPLGCTLTTPSWEPAWTLAMDLSETQVRHSAAIARSGIPSGQPAPLRCSVVSLVTAPI